VDLLDHVLAFGERDDLFISKRGGQHRILVGVCWDRDAGLDLAHDLDWNLNLIVLEPLLIKGWEVNEGDGAVVTELVPQLFCDVRCNGRSHNQCWLNRRTWHALTVVLSQVVGVLKDRKSTRLNSSLVSS